MQTWSCKISLSSWISMTSRLKKAKIKLDLLGDINMLLLVENGNREGIYHYIYSYAKAHNKKDWVKDYNKNKESP